MTNKSNTFASEEIARRIAKVAFVRASADHGKDVCRMYDDGKAVVVEHPDRMDGITVARYEWN